MSPKKRHLLYQLFERIFSRKTDIEADPVSESVSESLQDKKDLLEIQRLLINAGPYSFKPFFSSRVMDRINEMEKNPVAFLPSLLSFFRPVALAGSFALLLLAFINVGPVNCGPTTAKIVTDNATTMEELVDETADLILEELL